uniref:FAT atypical cadherin 4 n=1 Tax=Heligmosomoides polygyrus TaxID=6339 RepID=A0A8L8K5R9_HELPZ
LLNLNQLIFSLIFLNKSTGFPLAKNLHSSLRSLISDGSTGTSLVSIRVIDVNDNLPVFYPTDYNVTVREGFRSSAGSPLLVVSATDDDEGIFGEVHYALKTGSASVYRVDEKLGEVYLKTPLLRGHYEITIEARDGSGAASEEPARVHIYVIDPDATAPSFTQSNYVIRTPEDILPGISIGSVLATGPGTIRYSIYSGDLDHQFMIHPDTGRITVARYLDADKNDRVVLNVKAELQNGGSNHTQVLILIEDHNDNSPKFPIDMLEITVSENQTPHEPFYIVHATDRDKRKNGAIVYSLLSSHPPCPVMVQPLTGQLQLTEPLDFEVVKDYRIRIKAQDQGVPPRSANMTLVLHVSDFNDNVPAFENSSYEAEVAENSPLMTAVLRVKATDADSRENGKVFYRITNGSSAFGIDEKTGVIYTNASLDRESQSVFVLTVMAQDQGELPLSSSATVHVRVTDVNDNAPSCTSVTSLVVPFDAEPSTTVGTVVVSDPDNGPNGTVVYRSQQAHPLFVVKANGDVHLRRALVDSDPADVRLSIIASDQGSPRKSTVCHMQIRIGRGATMVKIVEPFERNIRMPHSCQTGCLLRKLNATGVAKWQIQSNDVSNHFTVTDGRLSMTSPPTSTPPWSLALILSDREGRQKHVNVRVLEPNSIVKICEATLGTVIATANATSPSPSTAPMYRFMELSNRFAIDQYSGEVSVVEQLDWKEVLLLSVLGKAAIRLFPSSTMFEIDQSGKISLLTPVAAGVHRFLVLAKSDQGDMDSLSIVLHVTELEKAGPRISSASCGSITVPENQQLKNFKRIVAVNFSNTTRFSIRGSSKFFEIDPASGELSSGALDREQQSEHLLVIVVEDGAAHDSCTVRVTVADENDSTPQFEASTPQLSSPQSEAFFRFSAFDHDVGPNGRVFFDLVEDSSLAFDLVPESGELLLVREPSEAAKEWMIRVKVYDQGTPSLGVDRLIRIQSSRSLPKSADLQPSFLRQKYVSSVDEGLSRGQVVSKLRTVPQLRGSDYSIVEGNTDSAFEIDGDGVVRTSQELDFEIKESYELKIIATGALQGQIQTHLSVGVGRSRPNQSSPHLRLLRCMIVALPIGSYVTTVTANDADNLAALQYSLDPKEERFVIDRWGISLLSRIRRSTWFAYKELGANSMFTVFFGWIPQATATDEVLTKLVAFDRDSGENGRVSYSLVESFGIFQLDSKDGQCFPIGSVLEYLLSVTASDHGTPSLSSTIPVRLTVTKEEVRQRPQFPYTSFEWVSERFSLPLHIVFGNVSVGELPYLYRIVDARSSDVFDIDQLGRLSLKAPLDREAKDIYSFTSLVFHHNSTATVTVRVTDVNDNSPTFSQPECSAKDADAGENGRVSYRILSGDDYGIFSVGSESGALIFNQWDDEQLTRHTDGRWTLHVEAKDHGTRSRSSLLLVRVSLELQSWSGSAPFFVLPSYVVLVPESAAPGSYIFTARATNRFGIPMTTIRYMLKENIRHKGRPPLELHVNGRSAVVSLEFVVLPVDEYPPVFTQSSYTFQVPLEASAGSSIGEVRAVDADGGVHGVPVYSIEPPSDLVAVDRTDGVVSPAVLVFRCLPFLR